MKQTLRNLRALGLAAALLLAAAPAARAVTLTASQLISIGSKAGMELAYHGYNHATSHAYGNGVGVTLEASQYGDDWVKVTNMFNGMVDLHFRVFNEYGNTYLTLGNNAGLSNSYGIYGQIMATHSTTYRKICVTPTNKTNSGDVTYTQIEGTVTYDATKNAVQIDFSIPMKVRYFTSSSATATSTSSKTEYYNMYSLMFYQPTASIADTKYTGTSTTGVDREYPAQFLFDSNNETFTVTNWGGRGMGTKSTATSTAPGFYNTWYRMAGHYDAGSRKMYMTCNTEYDFDASEIRAGSYSYYGNPYVYRMWAVNSAQSPTSKYSTDIVGDVTFDETTPRHTGTNLWATPHGGLKTTTTAYANFQDWGVYNSTRNDYGKQFGFRCANTVATIPDFDVTMALQHEGLTLVPGVTDDNLLPVNVTASFSVAKNDMFVESFDVYLVEGTSPKGAKTIFLGNVGKNSDNFYKVSGQIMLPSPDGKPWSHHQGESHSYTYTLKAVAHYATASSAPAADGKRMAAGLDDSNHGLGSSTLNFTVGVDGIDADDIEVRGTSTGLLVAAPSDMAVEVYDLAGRKVAEGVANTEISLGAGGVFVVKVANKAFKLMK